MTDVAIDSTALLAALALAEERSSGADVLRLEGFLGLDDPEWGDWFFPGRPRTLAGPSSFLMDRDLLVRGAEGDSILRLPWFDEHLFVGRSLPDIHEMPAHVRRLCVENYRAGLAGERHRFTFSSYGHAYKVDSVPVRDDGGRVVGVLGIARPASRVQHPSPGAELTLREVEVLQLAAGGLPAAEIAEQLLISSWTVETHFRNVYEKWGVADRAAAVAEAFRRGLID
jgi:DNA-binding CsgD family transcriptional regulator